MQENHGGSVIYAGEVVAPEVWNPRPDGKGACFKLPPKSFLEKKLEITAIAVANHKFTNGTK